MTYKIIDENGNTIIKGFRNRQSAINELPKLKLNKKEKLEVVEE